MESKEGVPPAAEAYGAAPRPRGAGQRVGEWLDRNAAVVFILPAVLVVLLLSIFPLLISLYLSLARLRFVPGGFEVNYVGLANYRKLFVGSERRHFLGVYGDLSWLAWLVLALLAVGLAVALWRYLRGGRAGVGGAVYRIVTFAIILWLAGYLLRTLSGGGRPGTVAVTLIYVLVGISLQYLLGLGLALLTTQKLPGRRLFRVIFLLPMMITPVGVAYMFRMITDTSIGPIAPFWAAIGLKDFSWVTDPWGARWAVILSDTWQWTPFMFIVLLAAVEGLPEELFEAAHVDGASRLQIFFNITLPQLIPVSATVVLIRMIEAFKIIDLPNVLTFGGPGTATESLTLHSFFNWRTLDLGGSSAIAYVLLFVSLFCGVTFANLIHQRVSR